MKIFKREKEERGERRRQGEVPKEGGSETLSSILPLSPLLSLAHISTRERKTLSSSRQLFRHDLLKPLLFPEQLGR